MNFGTVTSLSPLSVLVDGASTATPVNYDAGGGGHNIGDRVLWDIIGGQMCVISAPKQHYEEWDISPNNDYTIANGVVTSVHTFMTLAHAEGDYGAQLNTSTGQWSPPVNGIYNISCCIAFISWVGNSRYLMHIRNSTISIAGIDCTPNASGLIQESCSAETYLDTTRIIDVVIFQGTGATQTIKGKGGGSSMRSLLTIRKVK